MNKKCYLTNKKILIGNKRSHSMISTKKKFLPNIQNHKIWIEKINKFKKVKISTKGLKIIDKKAKNNFKI